MSSQCAGRMSGGRKRKLRGGVGSLTDSLLPPRQPGGPPTPYGLTQPPPHLPPMFRGGRHKMRGGNFYGAAVDPQIGTAGLAYPSVENVAANSATGRLIPNDASELNATPLKGGRHRKGHKTNRKQRGKSRKTRKASKKSRRTRRMRGGATYQSSANVGASYTGTGYAGIQNYQGYPANVPVAGGPVQGPDGVMKA